VVNVVGVTLTLTVPPTCFGLFTATAGTATSPTATAHTAAAQINFLIFIPFIAVIPSPLKAPHDAGRVRPL
jgi:hypothetical protein